MNKVKTTKVSVEDILNCDPVFFKEEALHYLSGLKKAGYKFEYVKKSSYDDLYNICKFQDDISKERTEDIINLKEQLESKWYNNINTDLLLISIISIFVNFISFLALALRWF